MAENKLVVLVEPQEVVGDGSDHMRALAYLKSKFVGVEKEAQTSSLSSSSKLQLQCPKVPKRLILKEKRPDDPKKEVQSKYAPKLISFGPYHFDKPHLAEGEKLKLNLAKAYIKECGASVDEIYRSISVTISQLRGCYDAESTKNYKDDEFTVMMLVDGCALLCYILCVCLGHDLEDFNIRDQDMSLLHQDAFLLKNQLPYQLLLDRTKMVELESYSYSVPKFQRG